MTTDTVMHFMRQAERNRKLLLYIVCKGPAWWRKTAAKQWRGLLLSDALLDSIYFYFVLQAGPNPADQLAILTNLHG